MYFADTVSGRKMPLEKAGMTTYNGYAQTFAYEKEGKDDYGYLKRCRPDGQRVYRHVQVQGQAGRVDERRAERRVRH